MEKNVTFEGFPGDNGSFKKLKKLAHKAGKKRLKNLYPDYWDTVESCSLAIMKEEFNNNKCFLLHCDNMKTRIQLEKIAENISYVAVSYYHECAKVRAMGIV